MIATKHARLVLGLKILCALIAVGLVSLLVMLPILNPVEEKFKLTLPTAGNAESNAQTMKNPWFQGINADNQPYNIKADVAVQKTKDTFDLENVSGDILLKGENHVFLKARRGTLSSSEKTLDLLGDIQLSMSDGQQLHTESAHIDIKEHIIIGQEAVTIYGPSGTLHASGFKAWNNEKRVVFNGPVKVKTSKRSP